MHCPVCEVPASGKLADRESPLMSGDFFFFYIALNSELNRLIHIVNITREQQSALCTSQMIKHTNSES